MADKVLIDIPYPEDCEHCLIGSLVPEYARSAKWLHYTTYCKVTGECVAGKERGDNCPLHDCKTGKWMPVNDMYNRISGRCSVCGWEAHMYEDDVVGMDYCPNCGARLEEKE